jgi:DNA-binding MarR family transcriptional regulator
VESSPDVLIHERLKILGVSLLAEWDALVFVYRHGTSLTSAAQIANLLGYDNAATGAALDRLESLGLIQRLRGSRSQGMRLYRFSMPTDPGRHSCLMELMSLTEKRTGRLLLLSHLHRGCHEPPTHARGLRLA